MEEYGNVLNTFSDYLIYDDRKGRILHTRYLNKAQNYEMWRFHFNRLRPDLSYLEHEQFLISQRIARGVLGFLRNESLNELKKAVLIDPLGFPDERASEMLINHLNYMSPSPATNLTAKMTSWIDASKNHAYVSKLGVKLESFGLHYPSLSMPLSPEQKNAMEDQLYQHFKSLLVNSN